jgi:multicomponent Na+:H+ antiporter subunit C
MDGILQEVVAKYNYWIYVVLMMIGFYAMIGKRNLVKKLLGMNIFQTAIILFFVSTGVKRGGGIPHVLMLTAIVVSVSVTGVALAVLQRIHREYGTLEEDEILERISE